MAITINGSGSITGISAGGLPDASITSDDIAAGAVTAAKLAAGAGGKILQVVSTQYGTPITVSQTAMVHADVPFSVNITPTTSTSLMLVSFSLMGETGTSPWNSMASFSRTISGTRTVVLPASYGSRLPGIVTFADSFGGTDNNASTPGGYYVHMFPDSNRPANTNQITYAPTVSQNSSTTFYLNRNVDDPDSSATERGISWITVMEVAA
jgi:hypothetical protein